MGDAWHLSPSAQEVLRLRAAVALVAGRDREEVAAVFGVSLTAVEKWWATWQAGGREALVMRPRGKPVGVHQLLGEAEQAAVRQAVLDHRPCDVGLSGQLWTRRLVGELIAKLYRVRLTEVGVGKYLKRWGLSFQRPDKRAVEQDPEAVWRWHEKIWPAIRAKAKRDGGEILFADQVGIRSDQVTGRTWGEKGKTAGAGKSSTQVRACSEIFDFGRRSLRSSPVQGPDGIMISRAAAPGLPRRDQYPGVPTSPADERQRQGHRDPGAPASTAGPAASGRQACLQ
ncbi:hypothetical protein SHXM_03051 [Streptomyces hygroscopicus]|nr:hypothetical protein SHXM_03051 [Streptomyces hygroscopicus]